MEVRSSRGVTIVELLIALCIVAILLAGLYRLFIHEVTFYSAQDELLRRLEVARTTVDKMTREIRMAGFKENGSTLIGIVSATSTTIRIQADLNRDGDVADPDEDVTYAFDPNSMTLLRTSGGSIGPLCNNVSDFRLTYVLVNGTETTNPAILSEIKRVRMRLTVMTGKEVFGKRRTTTLFGEVSPRNLKSESA
jgi:prepilin-type N-terminal cleavage/methylation domain-containing protein